MKNSLSALICLVVFAIALGGCTLPNQPVACTMEAKLCPDGSSVGRNPALNCEFDTCPDPASMGCAGLQAYLENKIEQANFCSLDSDCKALPLGGRYVEFGCYHFVNVSVDEQALYAKLNDYTAKCPNIIDDCAPAPPAQCVSGKCVSNTGTIEPELKDPPVLEIKNSPLISNLDGKQALVYELFIKTPLPVEFTKIEMIDSETNAVLKALSGQDFNSRVIATQKEEVTKVAILWLDSEGKKIPFSFYHKVFFRQGNLERIVTGAEITVSAGTPIAVSSPLKGENWVAFSAPPDISPHRRALLSFQWQGFFPERFAIDWLQFGPNKSIYKTNGLTNEDYYCYGRDLLAVSDGEIIDVKDGVPDNNLTSTPKHMPVFMLGGNYVVLQIDENHYAFYAHLIPGSLKVKIGDKVKKGQLIGKLGNSGNSDAPHLHFHISDSPNFLFSEGLPYLIDSYTLEGTSPDWLQHWIAGDLTWEKYSSPLEEQNTMPTNGDVVNFP